MSSRSGVDDIVCSMLLFVVATLFCIPLLFGSSLLKFLGPSSPGFSFLGITLIIIAIVAFFIFCCVISFVISRDPDSAKAALVCFGLPTLLVLIALVIFALTVSSKGGGKSIPGISYKEYHVESYSKWMQNKVHDTHNWDKYYKKAIVKENVCRKFGKDYKRDSLDKFHKRNLTPYESGCCKPSEECNFEYTSPTNWVKLPEIGNYSNVDCERWDNDPKTLCYDCESCKAALLQDVTYYWFYSGITIFVLIIVFIGLYCCCVMAVPTSSSSSGLFNRLLS